MPGVVPHFPSPASLNIETAIQDLKTKNSLMIQKRREHNLIINLTYIFECELHRITIFKAFQWLAVALEQNPNSFPCLSRPYLICPLPTSLSLLLAIIHPLKPLSVPWACHTCSCFKARRLFVQIFFFFLKIYSRIFLPHFY